MFVWAHCDAHELLTSRTGLLKIATSHFLISISDREQVAQIRGKPVYKITDVALIPLSSQADADKAIAATRDHLRRRNKSPGGEDEDTESEGDDDAPSVTDSVVGDLPPASNEVTDPVTGRKSSPSQKTSVAEDVIQRKGVYGRFADKWFSRKGWSFCFAFFRAGWSAASGWTDQPRGATEASVAQQDVILCITTTFMSTRI